MSDNNVGHAQAASETVMAAERHLRSSCAVMDQLIAKHGTCKIAAETRDPFQTLAGSIISQQLSNKAANTIAERVYRLLPEFSPAGFLTTSQDALRSAGLSAAKARYILELASRVDDGRLDFSELQQMADAAVTAKLIELPGIGRWTAEMFLIFGLHRLDVLSLGDAGLQRSCRLLFGEKAKLENVANAWRPYRSIASWYLWRNLDHTD